MDYFFCYLVPCLGPWIWVMNTSVQGRKHRLESEVYDLFISKMWSLYLCLFHRHFLTWSQCNKYAFAIDLPHLRHRPHVSWSTVLIRVSVPRNTHPRRGVFSCSLGSYDRIPQTGQLKEKTFIFHSLRKSESPQIWCQEGWFQVRALFLACKGLLLAIFSHGISVHLARDMYSVYFSSSKDTSHIRSKPHSYDLI